MFCNRTIFDFLMCLLQNGSSLKQSTTSGGDLIFSPTGIIINYKMFNEDNITNEKNKEHNKKQPFIPDHPHTILIIGSSGSRKTNALLNLIKEQDDIDKIYLYAKDLSEPKYEFLIKKYEDAGAKHLND